MMRKKVCLIALLTSLIPLMIPMQSPAAQEDTAKLTFTKTAVVKKPLYIYTVQKGDMLSAIVRVMPGITEKDVPRYYRMIKELNPEIDDLDNLKEGQEIVLPGKPFGGGPEKAASAPEKRGVKAASVSGTTDYRIKKGDTLIHIVHRELKIPSNTQQMMLAIKSLNPSIKDANRIFVGQVIRLPSGRTDVKAAAQKPKFKKEKIDAKAAAKMEQPVKIVETPPEVLPIPEEKKAKEPQAVEGEEAFILTPGQRLAVVKRIITQMNGTMMTGGNYYLPVSKTEQLTIDCAVIPVVELGGQTIFLDQGNRSNAQLKKIIHDRWSNFHLIKIDNKDDIIVVLKKILGNTKNFEISKSQTPISVGGRPVMEVVVDWMIDKKTLKPAQDSPIQGIRFVYQPGNLMPRAVVNYAREHSLFLTEISPKKGLEEKPDEIYSLPPVKKLPTNTAKDLTLALLAYLKIEAQKDADIKVFNLQKDGFNLSIKADVVVEKDGKKYLIFSRNLPPQFVNILNKEGNELIDIADSDPPAKTIETILRSFHVPTASGYFSFSGLDKNHPPYSFGFKGVKIKTDKDVYVVDFNFSEELRGLLHETWSAEIVRY